MEMKTYRVLRDHIGPEGELFSPQGKNSTREAFPNEVAHLVPKTLVEIAATPATADDAAKALKNKAATPAKEVKEA